VNAWLIGIIVLDTLELSGGLGPLINCPEDIKVVVVDV